MNKVIIGIIILVLLVGIGLIVSSNKKTIPSVESTPQEQNTVTLTSSGFSPATLTIKAGDMVTWVNKSGTDAAINSAPHPSEAGTIVVQ